MFYVSKEIHTIHVAAPSVRIQVVIVTLSGGTTCLHLDT